MSPHWRKRSNPESKPCPGFKPQSFPLPGPSPRFESKLRQGQAKSMSSQSPVPGEGFNFQSQPRPNPSPQFKPQKNQDQATSEDKVPSESKPCSGFNPNPTPVRVRVLGSSQVYAKSSPSQVEVKSRQSPRKLF